MKWIFKLNWVPYDLFSKSGVVQTDLFHICNICSIFCNAYEDERLGGGEFGKAGMCVCKHVDSDGCWLFILITVVHNQFIFNQRKTHSNIHKNHRTVQFVLYVTY